MTCQLVFYSILNHCVKNPYLTTLEITPRLNLLILRASEVTKSMQGLVIVLNTSYFYGLVLTCMVGLFI